MKPLLSVCLITFNHEKYIKQALEGILSQNVNFSWELIIADDYSKDGTREILLEFKRRFPHFIKLIFQDTNVGATQNWIDLIAYPKSKYIAYLEGDDYWTDPKKLQMQVDFLEKNPSSTICYHNVLVLHPNGDLTPDSEIEKRMVNPVSNLLDMILFGNYIHSPSVVFRNVIKKLPSEFYFSPIGDYFFWVLLAEKGSINRIDGEYAVYRNKIGTFSSKKRSERAHLFGSTLEFVGNYIKDPKLKKILELRIIEIKSSTFPFVGNSDFSKFNSFEYIRDNINYKQLISILFSKFIRGVGLK